MDGKSPFICADPASALGHEAMAFAGNAPGNEVIHVADLALDPLCLKAWRNGRRIPLSIFQLQLLQFLMIHPNRVFTRAELLKHVWNDERLDEGAVTACFVRLRRALTAGGETDCIRSARGIGYALDFDPPSSLRT